MLMLLLLSLTHIRTLTHGCDAVRATTFLLMYKFMLTIMSLNVLMLLMLAHVHDNALGLDRDVHPLPDEQISR